MKVGIFYFRPNLGGGSTTFTAHLFKALEAAGAEPTIYRVKERGDGRRRPFGKYAGVEYVNVDPGTARDIVNSQPTVMGSPAHSKYLSFAPTIISELMHLGMCVVIHDPNEFKIYDHLGESLKRRPICIRPTMRKFYPDALWIPHPYARAECVLPARSKFACSIARIASVKRVTMLLEANRQVVKKKWIDLRGAEDRFYTKFTLEKKFSDVFKQSGKSFQFPMTFEAPVQVAAEYQMAFDMTYFKDDGGGTQYAQMEAMDAGTVNVMHEDWFRYGGELKPGKHVLTVKDSRDITALLCTGIPIERQMEINAECAKLLKKHAPKLIGKQYLEEMTRG
jgi:hypothetical protein